MTVSTQTAKSQYTGNGVTTAFTGSFPILDQTHISVILTSTAGVDTTQTLTTDYTVSGVGGSTFTVTFLSAPASGVRVTIARNVPLTQELDLVENDEFPSAEIEKSYDKLTMLVQQINEAQSRSLKIPVTDPSSVTTTLENATDRANKLLGFDADGDPVATSAGTLALGDGDVTEAKIADNAVTEDKIEDNAVTNAKLATVATATFKGRTTAGTGNVEDLTVTQATALLNAVVGDSGSGGTKGLVPAPAAGDAAASKFLKADGTWASVVAGLTLATPVATTSGTAIDFTGIPSTARMIAVMFNGVSLSGTANLRIQIGDSGGVETTGYVGTVGSRSADTNLSSGFDLDFATAATAVSGTLLLTCLDTTNNVWTAFGIFAADSTAQSPRFLAGRKPLSATLDRVRITSSNGTDTFDAGSVNILYQ